MSPPVVTPSMSPVERGVLVDAWMVRTRADALYGGSVRAGLLDHMWVMGVNAGRYDLTPEVYAQRVSEVASATPAQQEDVEKMREDHGIVDDPEGARWFLARAKALEAGTAKPCDSIEYVHMKHMDTWDFSKVCAP